VESFSEFWKNCGLSGNNPRFAVSKLLPGSTVIRPELKTHRKWLDEVHWRCGDQISSPEGWENPLCEVLHATPELCRREKGDCRGEVRYTIYTETDPPTQPV